MIALYINDKLVNLLEDTSISIEDISPVWDTSAGGLFSYEFDIPVEENRGLLGNVDDVHGSSVYKLLNGQKFRLEVDGLPFKSGVVRLDEEVEITDGMVPIMLESGNKEFDELIGDLNCRDIDISGDDIQLGTAVTSMKVYQYIYRVGKRYEASGSGGCYMVDGYGTQTEEIDFPTKETLKPGSYANNSQSYSGGAAFCNIRLAYPHQKSDGDDSYTETDDIDTMEYNDQGAAPCFYVRYFLKKMFEQIGVVVKSDAMATMEDFNRLAFVNTNPCFDTRDSDEPIEYLIAKGQSNISGLHEKRGDDVYLDDDATMKQALSHYTKEQSWGDQICHVCILGGIDYSNLKPWARMSITECEGIDTLRSYMPDFSVDKAVGASSLSAMSTTSLSTGAPLVLYLEMAAQIQDVYATSENFPDEEVSSVVEALQNAFGLRFLFDNGNQTVKILLVRDILKDTAVKTLSPEIYEISKTEEDKRGFKLMYSASSDDAETETSKKTDYYNENENSAAFDYDDYSLNAYRSFADIRKTVHAFDKCCYLDKTTGNAYRIKVNSDAEKAEELKPRVFEVAQFCPAKEGDCSDEDYIETVSIGFTPVIPTNINQDTDEMEYALVMDVDVRTKPDGSNDETVKIVDNYVGVYEVESSVSESYEKITISSKVDYSFSSPRNFDRSSDAESPIFDYDWGFAMGVMRGPGSDGQPTIIEEDYDGEGNDKWALTSGSYAFHQDIMDNYGNLFDYNGSGTGTGTTFANVFSLRLRAEKENPAYTPELSPTDPGYVARFFDVNGTWAPKRGLYDKFYTEYAYWVLNRKTAKITCKMELAELVNIDMTKRYRIGGVTGFIKQVSYTINNDSGLSDVTVEMYYL